MPLGNLRERILEGNAFIEFRKVYGLTQNELARMLGVTRITIARKERLNQINEEEVQWVSDIVAVSECDDGAQCLGFMAKLKTLKGLLSTKVSLPELGKLMREVVSEEEWEAV